MTLTDLLAHASRAPFYRRRWASRPGAKHGRPGVAALTGLPIIRPDEWQRAVRADPRQVLCQTPGLWTLVACGGHRVWTAASHDDVLAAPPLVAAALRQAGLLEGDRVLALLPGAPSSWNALPYLVLKSDLRAEFLVLSIETLTYRPEMAAFAYGRQPRAFLASHTGTSTLEGLAGPVPAVERTVWYGDPAAGEPGIHLLALPGLLAPIAACPAGTWHLDPAVAVGEVLVGAGLQTLAGAWDGPGDLVLTTLTRAAPLVRLRTGLQVYRAAAPCSCASTQPGFRLMSVAHWP